MNPDHLTTTRSPPVLASALKGAPEGPILDIGCGGGILLGLAESLGRRLVGIDIMQSSIQLCRERAAGSSLDHEFHQADVRDFDIGQERWAAITAMTSLVAMRRREILEVLDAIRKGLIPGGIAYLEVFTKKDPIFLGKKQLDEHENDYYFENWQSHMYLFSPGELCLRMTKFDILEYKEVWVMDYLPFPHRHHEARVCCKKREENDHATE